MLRVAGLTPLSTTDFPSQLAAVVFVQGCAWRCRYCHNLEIQSRLPEPAISWRSVLDFLDRRQGLLDAVVFCGGEPTVDRYLGNAIANVRQRGFKIGLHTAGIYPERLRVLLPMINWVGFDVKASFADYAQITRVQNSGDRAQASLNYLLASGIEYEVRTTQHPALLSSEKLKSLAVFLRAQGIEKFALQEFRSQGCMDEQLDKRPPQVDSETIDYLTRLFPAFILRRANYLHGTN